MSMQTATESPGAPKITKACSRCRRLKVRCVRSDPEDSQSPCKRCMKGKRECKMDVSKRRRQHTIPPSAPVNLGDTNRSKPAPEVKPSNGSELMPSPPLKRLAVTQGPESITGFSPVQSELSPISIGAERLGGQNMSSASSTVSNAGPSPARSATVNTQLLSTNTGSMAQRPQNYYNQRVSPSSHVIAVRDQIMSTWKTLMERDAERLECIEKMPFKYVSRPENNAIAQGIISRDDAIRRLDIYRNYIFPRFPIVPIPNAPLEDIINQTPVLFHCILDVTSHTIKDQSKRHTNMILHNMAYTTVIQEIMITSTKSLELLQCLVVLTYWYNESEFYHRQRMFSLSTLAVSLAYDLGIGGSLPPGTSNAPIFEQIVTPQAAVDPSSIQCRLAWLSVYVLSFEYTSSNRRPMASYFNTYTQKSIDVISEAMEKEVDPDAYHLWHLAPIVHLHEQITVQLFKENNESAAPNLKDNTVQYLIQHFDHEIDQLTEKLPDRGCTKMALLVLRAYLHQAALYTKFDPELGRSPFTNFSLAVNEEINITGAKSFRKCFVAASEVLDMACHFDLEYLSIITMPIWNMIVLSCALVLKCRALVIFNKSFADACFVPEAATDKVIKIIEMGNKLFEEYPSSNISTSCNFLLKLLVCHNDARAHFWASVTSPTEDPTLGDPEFIATVRSGIRDPTQNQYAYAKPSSLETVEEPQEITISPSSIGSQPVSPSNNTPRQQEVYSNKSHRGNGASTSDQRMQSQQRRLSVPQARQSQRQQQLILPQPTSQQSNFAEKQATPTAATDANANGQTQGQYPHRPSLTPLERELAMQQMPPRGGRRISLGFLPEDYPLWQLSDDFWRDIIPSEANFGFDI